MRTKSIWCLGGGSGRFVTQRLQSRRKKAITIEPAILPEVNILGNIYRELIEADTDIEVKTSFGLNGASFCFAALEKRRH